jgi:hypothetical protein
MEYIDQELDRIMGVQVKEALRARLTEYNAKNE